ncbi:MAG: DUF234 domain-containing protein [Candidatus Hydrothermarchaeales archaeon]
MTTRFIDRDKELSRLREQFDSKKAEFLVVYGRRRVGKTELLKQFFKGKRHIYFLADMQKEERLLEVFSSVAREGSGKGYLEFKSWDGVFEYLRDLAEERIVVVFDEVGYINKANPAFYSILQRHWDEHLRHTKLFLVLCGSSVSMMEKEVLGYGSPLYGRRTGQIELTPLPYRDARQFFQKAGEEERIEFYSVLGGVPAYLNQFDARKDIYWNIKNNVLSPERFLYKEPKFILLEELRDPTTYFSILSAMSQGARRFNKISQKSYVEPTKLTMYLHVLMNLRLIERITQVTETKGTRRNSLYRIKDNFFAFWFRYVNPNTSLIEEGNLEPIMEQLKEDIPRHVSPVFEDVCRETIIELQRTGVYGTPFTKIGSWWEKEEEIDVVALNDNTKEILFGECKWTEKKVDKSVIDALKRKAEIVKWKKKRRKEHYVVFSKSGFTPSCRRYAEEIDVDLIDIEDIKRVFEGRDALPHL